MAATLKSKTDYTTLLFVNTDGTTINFTKACDLIQQSKNEKNKILASKIGSGYKIYCKLLIDKHCREKSKVKDKVIIIYLYDSKFHRQFKKGKFVYNLIHLAYFIRQSVEIKQIKCQQPFKYTNMDKNGV